MAKTRPPGGRPPGRIGRGGIGPPGGYPPPRVGKGTRHKSSSVEGTPIMVLVYSLAAMVLATVGSVVGYLLHGYGVL